jgi:hypothetical protein
LPIFGKPISLLVPINCIGGFDGSRNYAFGCSQANE